MWQAAAAQAAGTVVDRLLSMRQQRDQEANQREFAQSGIQWRVEDAKKAGIHPLYALGAQTPTYSPVVVGDSGGFASVGQSLGRAVAASSTGADRQQSQVLQELAVERAGLENDLLRAQIAKTTSTIGGQLGPPMPVAGTPESQVMFGPYSVEPGKVAAARPGASDVEAGPARPSFVEQDMGPLGRWWMMNQQLTEATEDMDILKYAILFSKNKDKLADALGVTDARDWLSDRYLEVDEGLRRWAEDYRRKKYAAGSRAYRHRPGSWGREAR